MQTINFNRLNLSNEDFLLDMGCGEGRHSIGAHISTEANILGFDLSFKDLKIAKERLNDFDTSQIETICQFATANIISIPLSDSSLDAVICSEVLEPVSYTHLTLPTILRV